MEKIDRFVDGYRWLSNFWIVPVIFEGVQYRSVEHAYVASKTLDLKEREHVMTLLNPGAAKRYGRRLTLRPDWDEVKLGFMEIMLLMKLRDEYRAC